MNQTLNHRIQFCNLCKKDTPQLPLEKDKNTPNDLFVCQRCGGQTMLLIPPDLSQKLMQQWRRCGELPVEDHVLKMWVKIFDPMGSMTWYICEQNPDNWDELYGFVIGDFPEWGYSSLEELKLHIGPLRIGLERDMHYTPLTVHDFKQKLKENEYSR